MPRDKLHETLIFIIILSLLIFFLDISRKIWLKESVTACEQGWYFIARFSVEISIVNYLSGAKIVFFKANT